MKQRSKRFNSIGNPNIKRIKTTLGTIITLWSWEEDLFFNGENTTSWAIFVGPMLFNYTIGISSFILEFNLGKLESMSNSTIVPNVGISLHGMRKLHIFHQFASNSHIQAFIISIMLLIPFATPIILDTFMWPWRIFKLFLLSLM